MAGTGQDKQDRTEKPSAKHKRDARQQGQVAKTRELGGWLSLLVVAQVLPAIMRSATSHLTGLFGQVANVITDPTPAAALRTMSSGLALAVTISWPVIALAAALSLFATVAQVGFVFSLKAAAPQFSRLNPIAGIKQLLSPATAWSLVKEVLKLVVVGLLSYQVIGAMVREIVLAQPTGLGAVIAYTAETLLGLVREVAVAGLVIAVGDYAYQRHQTSTQLKMTKQEVKEENRQQQGDPLLKGAIRRKQVSLSRSRMMAAVAGADVVVTNPTHVAVALRYEPGQGQAPRVVAKGSDQLAARIRQEARAHGVPVVEDPPLARAVFGACELDAVIPVELYVAVARLLAFVLSLPAVVKASGIVHRRPSSAMVG